VAESSAGAARSGHVTVVVVRSSRLSLLQVGRASCRQVHRRRWPVLCRPRRPPRLLWLRVLPYVSLCFCRRLSLTATPVDVVLPSLRWPLVAWPLSLLLIINIAAHYYFVCTVPPGFVDDHLQHSPPPSYRLPWAARRSLRSLSGVHWSSDLHITKAVCTRCTKCGHSRPEVRLSLPFCPSSILRVPASHSQPFTRGEDPPLPRLQPLRPQV